MDERVGELRVRFADFVRVFVKSERFTGPSWYFHRKALARRAAHDTIASLLDDDAFFDWLYATLTAWGLHRMGPGNTKLRDLEEIRESVRDAADALTDLAELKITDVGESQAAGTVDAVWSLLTRLRVSVAAAQIVANSKALHHLLPGLVPPMDREYTFRFFYGRTMLSIDEQTAFAEMFSRCLQVAAAQKPAIVSLIDGARNTGPAKVVDNAIVGYMIAREGAQPPNTAMEPTAPN
jgi:hypothetical protein